MSDTRSFKSAQISARQAQISDTSLALPAEENMAVLHKEAPDKNARVREQVRLTLARKKRDTISNGNIYSQDSTFDSGKGLQYSMTAQSPLHVGSAGMYSLNRLTRKGEMSPKSSTLFGSQNSGTGCQGAYTLPAARSFKHYTHSEKLLSQRVQAPLQTNQNRVSLHRSYKEQRSLPGHQQAGSLSLLTAGRGKGRNQGNRQDSSAASFASVELDSRVRRTGSMKAVAKLENQNGQQQAGSLSLLTAGHWKERNQGNKQDSCTTSFASVELDSRVGRTGSMKAAAKLENQNGQQQAGSLSLLTAGRGKGRNQGNRQDSSAASFASVDLDSRVGQTGSMKAAAKLENQNGQQQAGSLSLLTTGHWKGRNQGNKQDSCTTFTSVEQTGSMKAAAKMEKQNGVRVMNGREQEGHVSVLTLERALNQLSHTNTDLQVSAACYIQHQCFINSWCKTKLFSLGGIPKLLQVLESDNEELQKAGIGALRNAVYMNDENKEAVKEQNGIISLVSLLKTTRDIETRVQLTGLLWNLSSHDCLKERISQVGLQTLTESVIIPCSGIAEGENPKDDLIADPEIFYNATACLRNLSSDGPHTRTDMRECDSLIDALVHYVQKTIADHKADDKSTENCVCILHNLSYQMDAEKPQSPPTPQQHPASVVKLPGCFGSRSKEIAQATPLPLLEEEKKAANPKGKEWLSSVNAVRMYLSLVACSNRIGTLEAATGALLNATVGTGTMQQTMAHTIVKMEKGLPNLMKVLTNPDSNVRRAALSLSNNISRYPELHDQLVEEVLPFLISMLPDPKSGAEVPVENTVLLCRILTNLSQYESQHVVAIINQGALPKIMNISSGKEGVSSSRAYKAASTLLRAMWQHKDLHPAYIQAGYLKEDFIDSRTKPPIWHGILKNQTRTGGGKEAVRILPKGSGELSD